MRSDEILRWYEELLSLTRSMLDAARRNDWSALVQLEGERARVVEQLRKHDPDPAHDPGTRQRKRELIGQTVRHDQQIQLLTQDWMHELREVMAGVDSKRDQSD